MLIIVCVKQYRNKKVSLMNGIENDVVNYNLLILDLIFGKKI